MSTDGSNELQTLGISTTAPDNAKPERRAGRGRKDRHTSGRLLDLREAERYSGISWWTLRDRQGWRTVEVKPFAIHSS